LSCEIGSLGALRAEVAASAGGGTVSVKASRMSQRTRSGLGFFTGTARSSATANDVIRTSAGVGGSIFFSLDIQGSTTNSLAGTTRALTSASFGFNVNSTNFLDESAGNGTLIDGFFGVSVPNVDGVLRMTYGASDLTDQIEDEGMQHIRGARYHESLQHLTPADVFCGRGLTILKQRKEPNPFIVQATISPIIPDVGKSLPEDGNGRSRTVNSATSVSGCNTSLKSGFLVRSLRRCSWPEQGFSWRRYAYCALCFIA
jgi:hypothetical protein